MKLTQYLLSCILVMGFWYANAQEEVRNKKFKTKVVSIDNKLIGKGYLGKLNTSSISIYSEYDIYNKRPPTIDLNIEKIKRIQITRRGVLFKSFISGAVIGSIVGYASYKPENCGLFGFCSAGGKGLFYGLAGGLSCGILGSILNMPYNISLNGSQQIYELKKAEMYKFQY